MPILNSSNGKHLEKKWQNIIWYYVLSRIILPIQLAFNELLELITLEIIAVKAYDMNVLLGIYKESWRGKVLTAKVTLDRN